MAKRDKFIHTFSTVGLSLQSFDLLSCIFSGYRAGGFEITFLYSCTQQERLLNQMSVLYPGSWQWDPFVDRAESDSWIR
jgi:hypothetical protein